MTKPLNPLAPDTKDKVMKNLIKKFINLKDGVAAVEFALIVPVMLTMYVGVVEAGNFLSVNRKVTTAAATMADLVARAAHIDDDEIELMFEAVEVIMRPTDITDMDIVVTAVLAEDDGSGNLRYRVKWSNSANGNAPARAEDSFLTIPTTAQDPVLEGDYLVVSELSYIYEPIISGAPGFGPMFQGGIELANVFYDSPREDTFWRCATYNVEYKCDVNEYP